MKIEDAWTKWCPFARVATYVHARSESMAEVNAAMSCNRGDLKEMSERPVCIATQCMLWNGDGIEGQCGMMLHGSVIDANTG